MNLLITLSVQRRWHSFVSQRVGDVLLGLQNHLRASSVLLYVYPLLAPEY